MDLIKKALFLLIIVLIYIGDVAISIAQNVLAKSFFFLKQLLKSLVKTIHIGFLILKHIIMAIVSMFYLVPILIHRSIHKASRVLRRIFSRKRKHKVLYAHKHMTKKAYRRPSIWYKFKFFLFGVLFSFLFVFFPLLVFVFAADLPSPYNLSIVAVPQTTKIYDRNDVLLYEIFANQNRTVVQLDEIPENLRKATIAIEDKEFFNHIGVDLRGILRAAISNLQNNTIQGGSTITQQLIKSAFLTSEVSFQRKIKEVVLAFWAERVYTKDEILELYFNYVPYGGTAWGVQAASEIYFGKKVSDIDLAEAAFLAGIPRAPSIYSPFTGDGSAWKKRQQIVLDAMVKEGYITKNEADEAYKKKLVFRSPNVPIRAPHFVMYVKEYLIKKYGITQVEKGGLNVKTSLDVVLQEELQKIVSGQVENDNYLNISNGASLVTHPKTGEILAMVGSVDYFDREKEGNVNITTSLRQPGSTIKVVTYSLALSNGFTEATLVDDSPLTIPQVGGLPYSPVNYDGKFRGKLPLRFAFANSLNVPAVRVAQSLGVDRIVEQGQKMGITSWENPRRYGLSITLGGAEVKMIDLAVAYGVIANGGKKVTIDPLLEVTDAKGNIVYSKSTVEEDIVSEGVSYIISDILADDQARSMEFGLNSPLHVPNHRVSVKTGTTDNKRDNWTIGFTKDYLVTTWVGNNDNTPMSQALASGITGAAPMWNKIMTYLLKDTQDEVVTIPASIIRKSCYGRGFNFIAGTESSLNCSSGSPIPSLFIPTLIPTLQTNIIPTPQVAGNSSDELPRRRRGRNG